MKDIKICVVLFVILLSGCATLNSPRSYWYGVAVDSLAADNMLSKKTFILLPGNEGISTADLQFQEYAEYLKRVLNKKGYTYAASPEEADIAVFLSYGIGDPETYNYSYNFPVWGEKGFYAQTYVTKTTKDDKTTYSSVTTYAPRYGITGYRTQIDSRTVYNRFAVMAAYDYQKYRKEEKEIQLWKTTVTSKGSTDDLRLVFPVLMAASVPYIGTDTGHKIYISLRESDDIVLDIKGVAGKNQELGAGN